MITEEELKQQAEQIEAAYKDASSRIDALNKEQTRIINEFLDAIKQKRIEEIKAALQS